MFTKIDWELLPRVDQGQFVIKLNLPPGTRLLVTDSIVKKIEKQLKIQLPLRGLRPKPVFGLYSKLKMANGN